MSDKSKEQPSGKDALNQGLHLSGTSVPGPKETESNDQRLPEARLDETVMGPSFECAGEKSEYENTFVGPATEPAAGSATDHAQSSDIADEMNATFVNPVGEDSENDDRHETATMISDQRPAEVGVACETVVGSMEDSGDAEMSKEPEELENFATIVPVGMKERGTGGDPFTATLVGPISEVSDEDLRDSTPEKNAVQSAGSRNDATREKPNLTQGLHADGTFRKTAPQSREDGPRAESADLEATFVSASSDGADQVRHKMEQTAGLSGSGSKGPEGSQSGQNIKSNIWVGENHTSVDELVSIRRRPVSGTGQFAVEEGMDASEADFEIIEKLAEGGMGVVYVAKQKSLNRELAIKTLKGSGGSTNATIKKSSSGRQMSRADRQKREMFLSEALVTANLVHPNIIPIHELAETADGMPYYVMKRVHGIPWNKRIREMSLQENLDVLHKACDAIAYAHHHGVINRDLKPENIMLGEFGEVLVLDWGLAVPAPHAAEQNFRSPVASYGAGTPAYMSPELWMGPPEAIGECSDIYLLGAILFEIVTGTPPHEFPKVESKAGRSQLWQAIDNVLRINRIREVPQTGELLDIALKAMRTNPDERFGSVLEFQFAVRNYQRHEESRRLSARAAELVGDDADAVSLSAYHTYQTSAALFEESLRAWPQNTLARTGLRSTRLRYAQLASRKGDYDLGLQVTAQEPADPEFMMLSKKLLQARTVRSGIKWTALAAMLLVVALGGKSIYDNGIITNLNAEVTARKVEANLAISAANDAKAAAETALAQAETAKTEASRAEAEAVVAQQEAETSRMAAAKSNEQALAARDEAAKAQQAATQSRMEAAVAVAQAEDASKKVTEANLQLVAAEKGEAEARGRQMQAETAAKIAQVEIQTQAIRGLTLNENYSDALRQLDRLLEGELLPQLPEEIRIQRTVELNAQREQLLRRTRKSEEPIQSQSISPDGSRLAMGDSSGRITVLKNPATDSDWSEGESASIHLMQPIAAIRFVNNESLVAASGTTLHLWKIGEPTTNELNGHEAHVRGLDVQGTNLLSGDDSGRLLVWDLESRSVIAEMLVRSSIRDVAWIPGSRDFIYAGTRGEQSADILAYHVPELVPGDNNVPLRPERLGQLGLSRTHHDAPLRLSVSPDGQNLIISNSKNGNLLALRRADGANSRSFPFQDPAMLERAGNMSWLLRHHSRPVQDLSWSPDGLHLLSASDDRSIGVWDRSESGELVLRTTLRGHGARVTQASFVDQTSTYVVSSSTDGFSRLWNLATHENDSREILKAFGLAMVSSAEDAAACPVGISEERLQTERSRIRTFGRYQFADFAPADLEFPDVQQSAVDSKRLNTDSSVHRAPVQAVQFAEDGSLLVTGAADGTIALWDATTLKPIRSSEMMKSVEVFREGHEFNVSRIDCVDVPGDGSAQRVLITSGFDGSVRLWDMDAGSKRRGVQLQVIHGVGLLNAFAASKDGRTLVTTASDSSSSRAGDCLVWSIPDLLSTSAPKPVLTLTGAHRSEVTAIAISHDGGLIATGSREGMIAIWRSVDGAVITRMKAHAKNTSLTSLAWLRDGTLISAGLDGQLSQWSITKVVAGDSGSTAQQLRRSRRYDRDGTPIERVTVSPDERQMLVISAETSRKEKTTTYRLSVWTLFQDPAIQNLSESLSGSAVAIPTDNEQKDSTGRKSSDRLAERRVSLASVEGQAVQNITSAHWSDDGHQVVVSTDLGIQLIEVEMWRVTRVFVPGSFSASDAQFTGQNANANENSIVTFDGTTIGWWNLSSGELICQFRGPFPVTAVSLTSAEAGKQVLAAGRSLRVFDGQPESDQFGRPLFHQQKTHRGGVSAMATGPTGTFAARRRLIVTGGEDGSIKMWHWNAPLQILEWTQDVGQLDSRVTDIAWSDDGSRLVAVTSGGQIASMRMAEKDNDSLGYSAEPMIVSSSPAGPDALLATCDLSFNGDLVIVAGQITQTSESIGWVLRFPSKQEPAVHSLQSVCAFSGHDAGGVSAVAFAADSPYLISGGNDGALILWNWQQPLPADVPLAYEAYRFLDDTSATAHNGPITCIDVQEKSRTVASGSSDTTIALWSLAAFLPAAQSP